MSHPNLQTQTQTHSTLLPSKTIFLTTQIRLLNTPLRPSLTFNSHLTKANASTDNDATYLPPKSVDEAVSKVNERIRAHNKLVFSEGAKRHVAEQVESLYFAEAIEEADDDETERVRDDGYDGEEDDGGEIVAVERDLDLTSPTTIAALPPDLLPTTLNDVSDFAIPEAQSERYSALQGQLLRLSKERDAAREKVARYERLIELLRPFEDVERNVQENLVTRDGGLEKEMERMRVLVARVVGRAGEMDGILDGGGRDGREAKGTDTFEEKLRQVMEIGTEMDTTG